MESVISQICLQLAVFLMISIHLVSSEDGHNATTVQCYQCNSGESFDGPKCGDEPATADLSAFLKTCPAGDGLQYTRCRKIVQTVEEETRVVRSCATEGAGSGDKCLDRVGTARIKVKYCECHNGNSAKPCNSAHRQIMTSFAMTTLLFSAVTVVLNV